MNILYKSFQMPKEFMDAVETIMKYCQNEDCQEDCKNCPCTLAEIRCGDTAEESGYVKEYHELYEAACKEVLEQAESEDCRDCKKWEDCPCGKEGHESETSQGYSIGGCKDFEPQESEV